MFTYSVWFACEGEDKDMKRRSAEMPENPVVSFIRSVNVIQIRVFLMAWMSDIMTKSIDKSIIKVTGSREEFVLTLSSAKNSNLLGR